MNIDDDYHNEDDNIDEQTDGNDKIDQFKLNRFGSMLVARKKMNENSLSKFISPSINSSSSCPREEQVSEEFIINGKRYRQVYQRRIVLERKTTRDVSCIRENLLLILAVLIELFIVITCRWIRGCLRYFI